jgi:hypothetical protein
MSMFGRGVLRHLTLDLPDPQARTFSDTLFRACGCRLAWHHLRGTYTVYRDQGPHHYPQTYLDIRWPSSSLIPLIVDAVRLGDARRTSNYDAMLDVYNRRWAEESDKETRDFIADFMPDVTKELERIRQVIDYGRLQTKYFDTKPGGAKVSSPTG